jgi:maltokinase
MPSWSELISAADPALVLPSGERRAEVEVPGPLRLDALLDLGDGHAVAVVRSADAVRWTVPLLRAGAAGLRRSRPGDGTAERLVAALAHGDLDAGDGFVLDTFADASADGSAHTLGDAFAAPVTNPFTDAEPSAGERGIAVDQTNESVIVGERAVVKWAVRLPAEGEPGSPAARRIAALARGGFADMPQPWGLLTLTGDEPVLLASVVAYLPGVLDGWDWAVDDVRRLARSELTPDQALVPAERLGTLTARMHVALAAQGRTPATATDVDNWGSRMRDELREAVASVPGDEGERLAAWSPRIAKEYAELGDLAGTPLIDVHGDFHVGQVLHAQEQYAVVDFDGNPVLPPAQRAARQPAALDVVGMAASLDHVGRIVIFRTPDIDPGPVREWIVTAQRTYLDAYRTTLAALGASELFDERLVRPLRLAQEVREHLYAVRHLPHWVYVPDLSLADLLPKE